MERFFRKHAKWLALTIGVLLLAQTFAFVLHAESRPAGSAPSQETREDAARAADISNRTGVRTDRDKREELRVGADLEETVSLLKDKGFAEDEILEAKMLAERMQFQLQEIAGARTVKPEVPETAVQKEENKDDRVKEAIRRVSGQYELRMAVYAMVMLRKDLGGLEAALDEYLLSLQIDVAIEGYFQDKAAYLKEKQEKIGDLGQDERITASVVEAVLLEQVQQENRQRMEAEGTVLQTGKTAPSPSADSEPDSLLPDVPAPGVADVRPENPTDRIMKEIEALNPNRP